MSIATAIQNAQQKVANAYTAVSTKGGTLPATQDLSNLPTAIESIPSGGGGGDTVDVKAVGDTASYDEGDKVILTPTEHLFDTTTYYYSTTISSTATQYKNVYCPVNGMILDYTKAIGIYGNRNNTRGNIQLLWNDAHTAVTGSFTDTGTYVTYISPEYRTGNHWAVSSQAGYESEVNDSNAVLGYYRDGVFSQVFTGQATIGTAFINDFATQNGTVYNMKTGISYNVPSSQTPYQFPVKYNGTWYIACCGRYSAQQGIFAFNDLSTKVYDFSGWNYYSGGIYNKWMQFVDDDVDYILACPQNEGYLWKFFKINKNSTAWSVTHLSDVSSALQECYNRDNATLESIHNNVTINCKDYGEYVEMFVSGYKWGYNANGGGNKVGHFKFYKATDTIERLPDVFPEIDGYEYAGALSVNWELGLISICLSNYEGTRGYALYVKKFDDLATAYPYYAYPNSKDYYYKDSITGFVTENKGVDALGNTVLEVETVQDPDYHWNPVGRVIGMNVTVNEGEPG